jgi:hypothetical protein
MPLLIGVFLSLGWQLSTQLSAVLQLSTLLCLRACLVANTRLKPDLLLRCSPLAICSPVNDAAVEASAPLGTSGEVEVDFSYTFQGFACDALMLVVVPTAGAYTRSHPISAQFELSLPLSAQLKLTLSPIDPN